MKSTAEEIQRRKIEKAEKAMLSSHEHGLLQRTLISLCYTYSVSPIHVMGARVGSKNMLYARQALCVAGREMGLSLHKIGQFLGIAHSTVCYHYARAAHEQQTVGLAAAIETVEAMGHES